MSARGYASSGRQAGDLEVIRLRLEAAERRVRFLEGRLDYVRVSLERASMQGATPALWLSELAGLCRL